MAKRVKWTDEEDEILVQAVKANIHNKAQAFREAAEKVPHNTKSCACRWYHIQSNPEHKKYVGCMFTMIGVTSRLYNRTQSTEVSTPIKNKRGIWSKIKALLGI